ATDAAHNASSKSFEVTVVDTTAPSLTVPGDISAEATSAAGAVVSFAASATDAVSAVSIVYSQSAGTTFALGATTVTVTATDAAHNACSQSFKVTVVDTTVPALTVPADITAEATSSSGAIVSFVVSATDAVSTPSISYSQAPGSTFALGVTTVIVTATDGAHNSSSKSFKVTVVDTTAPSLTVPADLTAE